MDPCLTAAARQMRDAIARGTAAPHLFREKLGEVPPLDRDPWVDVALGVEDPLPSDGAALPSDGVPFLPCAVANLEAAIAMAGIVDDDVVVDVGGGNGRAASFLHHHTGAQTFGVEIQPQLAAAAKALPGVDDHGRLRILVGDASAIVPTIASATVYFFYCPFSGRRLDALVDAIGVQAQRRKIRVCTVGLGELQRPWLQRLPGGPSVEVAAYQSRSWS
jgi:SAM-dependent methyltransferase